MQSHNFNKKKSSNSQSAPKRLRNREIDVNLQSNSFHRLTYRQFSNWLLTPSFHAP